MTKSTGSNTVKEIARYNGSEYLYRLKDGEELEVDVLGELEEAPEQLDTKKGSISRKEEGKEHYMWIAAHSNIEGDVVQVYDAEHLEDPMFYPAEQPDELEAVLESAFNDKPVNELLER